MVPLKPFPPVHIPDNSPIEIKLNKEGKYMSVQEVVNAEFERIQAIEDHRDQVRQIVIAELGKELTLAKTNPKFVVKKQIEYRKNIFWKRVKGVVVEPTVSELCGGNIRVQYGDDHLDFAIIYDWFCPYDVKPTGTNYSFQNERDYTSVGAESWHDRLTTDLAKFKVVLGKKMVDYIINFGKACEVRY